MSARWPQEGSDSSAGTDDEKWCLLKCGLDKGGVWLAGWLRVAFPSAASRSLKQENTHARTQSMVDPESALC